MPNLPRGIHRTILFPIKSQRFRRCAITVIIFGAYFWSHRRRTGRGLLCPSQDVGDDLEALGLRRGISVRKQHVNLIMGENLRCLCSESLREKPRIIVDNDGNLAARSFLQKIISDGPDNKREVREGEFFAHHRAPTRRAKLDHFLKTNVTYRKKQIGTVSTEFSAQTLFLSGATHFFPGPLKAGRDGKG